MAPSRGLTTLQYVLRTAPRTSVFSCRAFSSFSERLADPSNKVQSYISRSNDPYLNLAIEDHILRNSPADSAVLFLYTNRPCVVIGRNQNPWREVNLSVLNAAQGKMEDLKATEPPGIGDVQLVRRRSGGGTVFHDLGNVNWSITSPREAFTRDRHAEMVVRALRKLGVDRARVNERHDIVLDQGNEKHDSDPQDTHRTPYTVDNGAGPKPLKVSGSAYKLTRGRALHHATTLLESPNLHIIPQYLHSPAKPYLDAKGVESVSSPVGNIGLDINTFQKRIQEEFAAMYAAGKEVGVQVVGEDYLNIPQIKKGYDELQTNDWILTQTPQFTVKLDPTIAARDPPRLKLDMNVQHGIIQKLEIILPGCPDEFIEQIRALLIGKQLQDVGDWDEFFKTNLPTQAGSVSEISAHLNKFLPIPDPPSP
ncbi:hypothetical protein M011DRAFT_405907 [Sporormia fimetaria CBS 119925]|uniref:Putative lipoate-protein ligase A n=1 Tax=Sporormia fimetaria CBS 119925 TaxID=1340428 RepID=A0A6A6V737_9PLEO|nr:hypothetical protein M011DRAFT_405907 [Sporormia fimetaria CBS 119925]